eukprot:2835875-Heterocapsa_arctica.AAC.1
MQRYRRRNHDRIFDGWWACQSCLAKGPALNERNCINPTHTQDINDEDDDRHKHKRRRTDLEAEKYNNDDRSDGGGPGVANGGQGENSQD